MTTRKKQDGSVPPAPAPAATPAAPVAPKPGEGGAAPTGTSAASELHQLQARADENWDKFLRAAAELENYRKRVAREREELVRSTRERVVAALLPVLDNLERAIAAASPAGAERSALVAGLGQVELQFKRVLADFGVEEVTAQAGHPFDPNWHEAVAQIESAAHPEGTILDQIQRGYKLTERLLRPARVVVSKSPASPPAEAADPAEPQPQ